MTQQTHDRMINYLEKTADLDPVMTEAVFKDNDIHLTQTFGRAVRETTKIGESAIALVISASLTTAFCVGGAPILSGIAAAFATGALINHYQATNGLNTIRQTVIAQAQNKTNTSKPS